MSKENVEKAALAGGRYVNTSGKIVNFAQELQTCETLEKLAHIQQQATPIQNYYGGSVKFRTLQKLHAFHDVQKSLPVFQKQTVIQEVQKYTQKLCIQESLKYQAHAPEIQTLKKLLHQDLLFLESKSNLKSLRNPWKYVTHEQMQIPYLQDWFKKHKEKIKIDLAHIFKPELRKNFRTQKLQLYGFHHDYEHQLEKVSKTLHFVQETKQELGNGFYEIGVHIARDIPENIHTKTFFPAHWTREEVMECVHEKFKNIIRWSDKDDLGKSQMAFVSHYDQNIDIVYIFDELKGEIITIYPSKRLQ